MTNDAVESILAAEPEVNADADEASSDGVVDEPGRISSYSTIWHLDHGRIEGLFVGPVVIQEKLDGSQFSAGVLNGELVFRSRKVTINPVAVPDLFRPAVDTFQTLHEQGRLVEGWVYRGEAICRERHNTLKYERVPNGGFVLFDIEMKPGVFLGPGAVQSYASNLGLECVRTYFEGETNLDDVRGNVPAWLAMGSTLGQSVEPQGIVVKNYNVFTPEKKVAMGKFVTVAFKEKHQVSWREQNPTRRDIILGLVQELRNENRWRKAIQHGIEEGHIDAASYKMQDMKYLAKEIPQDIRKEEEAYIKQRLFDYFWPEIFRGAMKGLPEWFRSNYVTVPLSAPESQTQEVVA